MAKDKKASAGKKKQGKKSRKADGLLDDAAKSLKKFRKVTRHVGRLSTGQKLVGGIALVAAGLTYWAKKQATEAAATAALPGAQAAEAHLATLTEAAPAPAPSLDWAAPEEAAAPARPRKPRKSK